MDKPIALIEEEIFRDLHYSLKIDFKILAKSLSNQPAKLLKTLQDRVINEIQQDLAPYNDPNTSPLHELIQYLDDFINQQPTNYSFSWV